jgi:tetratricopeptide (TPR) repeat protein
MLTASSMRRMLPAFLLLTLVTAGVYGQVWNFGFINYDDPIYVTDNVVVRKGLTWEGIRWAFTTNAANIWHPLTWLSHMLDVSLFGLDPGFHHLVNLLFHLLNTSLLFLVLKTATGACWRSAFVAALFALHPLHVESVAWIAERKDVLSTFFWLLTMGAYVLHARRPGIPRYLPVLLFFSLGLMAKPMLVSLPIVLLLMDYWPLGRLPERRAPIDPPKAPAQPAERDRKKAKKKKAVEPLPEPVKGKGRNPATLLLLEKIPLVVLAGIFSFVAFYTQQKGGALSSLEAYPLGVRLTNAVVSYALYLFKTVWPVNLAVFYPYVKEIPGWQVLASAALLLSASIAVVRYARRFPYLAFGWLWYLVTLMPVIGIIKVGDFSMADRYTYIALIGPFVAATWGGYDLAARWTRGKEAMAAAALLVVIALAAATFVQAGTWKNSATLFRHALAATENNFMAHTNLAVAYIDDGKLDDALTHLREARQLRPDFPHAPYNMGVIKMRQGRSDEAMDDFKTTLRADPGYSNAYVYLGRLHLQRGQANEAAENLQQALRTGNTSPSTYAALADALAMQSRHEEALSYYRKALALGQDMAEVHYNASMVFIATGRIDEAIGHLREAVRIRPDYARAHNNLGSALLMQKRLDEAAYHFQEAVRIDPGYTMARENLKDALAQKKKLGR